VNNSFHLEREPFRRAARLGRVWRQRVPAARLIPIERREKTLALLQAPICSHALEADTSYVYQMV